VGCKKLTTVWGRFNTYRVGVRIKSMIYSLYYICTETSIQGGLYAHDAYDAFEAKKIKVFFWLSEYMGPTLFLYKYILLKTSSAADYK
jgi:hypothetical protein